MREQLPEILEKGRHRIGPYASDRGDRFGFFGITIDGKKIKIMSSGEARENEWEHVSVSIHKARRCPEWEVMCKVKELFWGPEECVIQFHPPRSQYVNFHPGCLHLWKPPYTVPTPPSEQVGPEEKKKSTRRDVSMKQQRPEMLENERKPMPCPFCGGHDLQTGEVWDQPGGYVRCACGATMQTIGKPVTAAIIAWNKRVGEEDIASRLLWP